MGRQTQAGTEPLVAALDDPTRSKRGSYLRGGTVRIIVGIVAVCEQGLDGCLCDGPESQAPEIDTHRLYRARTNPLQSRITAQVRETQNSNHLGDWWLAGWILGCGRGRTSSGRSEHARHGYTETLCEFYAQSLVPTSPVDDMRVRFLILVDLWVPQPAFSIPALRLKPPDTMPVGHLLATLNL